MDINNSAVKDNLLREVSPLTYQTFTAEDYLTGVGTSAEVVVHAHNKPLWITNVQAFLLDGNGKPLLQNPDIARDDVVVHVNIGGVDFTNQAIPLQILNTDHDNPLFSGFLLDCNQRITFRFTAKHLRGNENGLGVYPILCKVVLKGYDM
jgi:hypothetical protein